MTIATSEPSASQSAPRRSLNNDQIVELVARLRKTFDAGVTRPLEWRLAQLHQFAAMVHDNEDAMLEALRADLGKPEFEAWIGETSFVMAELKYTIKRLPKWIKPKRVKAPLPVLPAKARLVREPLGVVLIIAPWNYPLQLALGPMIGAIAGGNAVVLKPSEVAPASSALLARLIPKYFDPEAIAVVEGGVPETTKLLEQRFDHIFYTGNGTVGRIVMEAAAKHLTPVTLELGGKSPCIVDQDVDLDVAARRIVWGKFFNAGQTCVAPDYVLVHESIEKPLLERISANIKSFYGDDPKESTSYARVVNERHHQRLTRLLGSGEVVVGGDADVKQRYLAPTVLKNVSPDSPVMQDEIFGPILPVLSVPNVEAAIDFVNAHAKPLALYVFTRNKQHARDVLERTSSGGACVNDVVSHLVPPELPFGGVGPSGMGAYHGRATFDTFTHQKSVLDKGTSVDPALRYPPYNKDKFKWAKRLM
jgi:aldehyde dehydrogenase (NAD+)